MNNKADLQLQFINAGSEALLSTAVVSAYTGLSLSWFNNKAVYGGGIPYIKILTRRMYKKADVLEWLKNNSKKVVSTSEY